MNEYIKKYLKKTGPLAENEVKDLLNHYNIGTTDYKVIKNIEDLDDFQFEFPVALKVCSDKILHKTDVKGVKLNIKNLNELKKEFIDFKKRFPSENFLVDKMVDKGIEIILGLIQDPTFGLCIMYGVGGIFTELYKDVSFRVIPIDEYDAVEMTEEIKGKKLLEGFRNINANKKLVIDLILKLSKIGEELIDIIDQMDLNPVFVYDDDIIVVDAKLILKG